jgi:beta-aspartyl-dipeptidase (metallo-type)
MTELHDGATPVLIVDGGEVMSPAPLGCVAVVVANGKIVKTGRIDRERLLGEFPCELVDASDAFVIPGLVDPHVHLLGGSGEDGFATQTPEVMASELLLAGITSVVGTLGTDTTTRTLPSLLGKVKALREEGLGAWMWTGGYDVPPKSLTGSVRDDIVLIDEIIGVGETAIADARAMEPTAHEIARLATDCYIGGILTRKAGVLHLHVGPGSRRLELLRDVLDRFEVKPETLYPTHVERDEALMTEALELTRRGVTIDLDVFELDLARWIRFAQKAGADLTKITASTDTAINAPWTLLAQLRECVTEGLLPLHDALTLGTSNAARVLKLRDRGRIGAGACADLVVVERESLAIRHVIAGGELRVRDGALVRPEKFLDKSTREIHMRGRKTRND